MTAGETSAEPGRFGERWENVDGFGACMDPLCFYDMHDGADYVAASFIRSAANVRSCVAFLERCCDEEAARHPEGPRPGRRNGEGTL